MSDKRIELHLHLEGAAPPDLIRRLAEEKHQRLVGVFDAQGRFAFRDFGHFLQVYEAATSVLTTPQDYARLVTAVAEDLAAQQVIYGEVFVSPAFCGNHDVAAWRDYLAAMQEAATQAEARHGVTLRGIVTAIRHMGPEVAKQAAHCAAETAGDWIVGFGMGGDERMGKPGDFAWSFDLAREAGLGLTVHAGEFGGPDSVRDALDDLRVSRIGHGVRAAEDHALIDRLAESGTVLEVCPGSNLKLGLFPDWTSHPIDQLRRAGVAVTVSTDDPPFFHTTLSREYERLAEVFDWQAEDFQAINVTAAQAAFCDAETRARLLKLLETDDDRDPT